MNYFHWFFFFTGGGAAWTTGGPVVLYVGCCTVCCGAAGTGLTNSGPTWGVGTYAGFRAAVVGWSDGAILGLEIALRHRARLSKLFAFAANSDPSGVKDVDKSPVFTAFIARAAKEYEALSATPDQYKSFLEQIGRMWATQPHYTAADLKGITTPTWIVDADHDEAIKRENTEFMAAQIPGAGLLIQPEVSHFSFLQDPVQFTWSVMHFLARH